MPGTSYHRYYIHLLKKMETGIFRKTTAIALNETIAPVTPAGELMEDVDVKRKNEIFR